MNVVFERLRVAVDQRRLGDLRGNRLRYGRHGDSRFFLALEAQMG